MIRATKEDRKLVKNILVSAFLPYTEQNSINLVINPKGDRKKRLEYLMGYLFDISFMFLYIFWMVIVKTGNLLSMFMIMKTIHV